MAFKSSIYSCSVRRKRYRVDVTKSVPNQKDPAKVVIDAFTYLRNKIPANPSICDFGAGRLRNTNYLLKKGFNVWAVEYERLYTESADNMAILEETRQKYPSQFESLIFPDQFEKSKEMFDVILFVYVANVIPRKSHRHLALRLCSQRLKKNGYFLWVTPGSDTHMKRLCEVKYRDGWILNIGQDYQTFYREFSVEEINELVSKHNLDFHKRFEYYKNPARLYLRNK